VHDLPVMKAEVLARTRVEMARHLTDVVRRRLPLYLSQALDVRALASCATLMQRELEWTKPDDFAANRPQPKRYCRPFVARPVAKHLAKVACAPYPPLIRPSQELDGLLSIRPRLHAQTIFDSSCSTSRCTIRTCRSPAPARVLVRSSIISPRDITSMSCTWMARASRHRPNCQRTTRAASPAFASKTCIAYKPERVLHLQSPALSCGRGETRAASLRLHHLRLRDERHLRAAALAQVPHAAHLQLAQTSSFARTSPRHAVIRGVCRSRSTCTQSSGSPCSARGASSRLRPPRPTSSTLDVTREDPRHSAGVR